jgi:flagella basal body P-ring formation protein FlgA
MNALRTFMGQFAVLAVSLHCAATPLQALAGPALASRLCAAAVQAVEEQAGRTALSVTAACRHDEASSRAEETVSVAVVRPPSSLRTGPTLMVMRVQPKGADPVLIALGLDLRVYSQAWLSKRDILQGEHVRESDLVRQAFEWPAGVTPQVAGTDSPSGRARHAVRAGQPVAQADLLSDQDLSRGEAVTVLIQEGELSLRVPARVTADAKVGGQVRAQLHGRRDVVEGVLVDADTVLVGTRSQ